MKIRRDLIFAKPSFLEGAARIFDFGGALNEYNYDKHSAGAEADATALASDWDAIGFGEMWEEIELNPATLKQYDDIAPGSADRILSLFESQMKHRTDVEKRVVGDSNRSYLGLAAGFILSVMIVLGGFYVMINVHPWAGASVIGTQIAVIAGVFVYGTRSRRDERDRKSERTRPLMVHDVPDDDQPQPLDSEEQDQANRD